MAEKRIRPIVSSDELITTPFMKRPHVVIMGAGASRAACVNGDRNGHRLPTMDNLVQILEMEPLLARNNVKYARENFEALYSSLHADPTRSDLIQQIERDVYTYFASLKLPNHPTIYDHLLLSLRRKDAVFTFNWDPFLFDAWARNRRFILPEIFFLHGNVRVAYCLLHPHRWGSLGLQCPDCGKSFVPTKLLYPITVKKYTADQFIASQWEAAQGFLANAFTLTIFGYGAPTSDVEAVNIMNDAWSRVREKLIERVEIIDIRDQNELYRTWEPFISHHHYDCRRYFYDSYLARYPRRSGEALYAPTVQGRPAEAFPIPQHLDFTGLNKWVERIAEYES